MLVLQQFHIQYHVTVAAQAYSKIINSSKESKDIFVKRTNETQPNK
jgi:hypothetical protein